MKTLTLIAGAPLITVVTGASAGHGRVADAAGKNQSSNAAGGWSKVTEKSETATKAAGKE